MGSRSVFSIVVILAVLLIGSRFVYIVDETESAVLLKFGELTESGIEPGLHFKVPIMHEIRKFDVRVRTLDSPTKRYLTIEKKPLDVDSYAAWRVIDPRTFYRSTSGIDSRAIDLLSSRIDNGLRDQFGKRTMNEVISGERAELVEELNSKINSLAQDEFGVEILDVRVKGIDLPTQVSSSVYNRMESERDKEAQEHRSKGQELAEGIRADADRQVTIIEAEAYRESQRLRGEGDAQAAQIYADAYTQDEEFYSFTRSLTAYEKTFADKGDLLILEPESDFFKYLKRSNLDGVSVGSQ